MEEMIKGYQDLSHKLFTLEKTKLLDIISKVLKPLGCLPYSLIGKKLVVLSMLERISKMQNHANAFIFWLRVPDNSKDTDYIYILGPFVHS